MPLVGSIGQQIACTTTNAASQNGQNGQNLQNQNGQEIVGPVVDPIDMAAVNLKTLVDLDDVEKIRLPAISQNLSPQLFAISKDIAQQNQQFSIGANPSEYKSAHTCITLYTLGRENDAAQACGQWLQDFHQNNAPKTAQLRGQKEAAWVSTGIFILEDLEGSSSIAQKYLRQFSADSNFLRNTTTDAAYRLHRWARGDALATAKLDTAQKTIASGGWITTTAKITGPFTGNRFDLFPSQSAPQKKADIEKQLQKRKITNETEQQHILGVQQPARRNEQGAYWVNTQWQQGQDANSYFFIESSGPIRVLIDDQEIFQSPWVRAYRAETNVVPVQLTAGQHQIRILTWASSGDRLSLACLREDNQACSSNAPIHTPTSSVVSASTASTAVTRVTGSFVTTADDADAALWELVYTKSEWNVTPTLRTEKARQFLLQIDETTTKIGTDPTALEAWSKAHPTVALGMVWFAEALQADLSLDRSLAERRAIPMWRWLSAAMPSHPWVAYQLAQIEANQRPDDNYQIAKDLYTNYGTTDALLWWLDAAIQVGALDEVREIVEILSKKVSSTVLDTPTHILRALQNAASSLGDEQQEQILLQQLRRQEAGMTDDALALWFLNQFDYAQYFTELERICRNDMGNMAEEPYWKILALQDPEKALQRIRAVRLRYPNDVSAIQAEISITQRIYGIDAARKVWRSALARLGLHGELVRMAGVLGLPVPWEHHLRLGDEMVAKIIAQEMPKNFAGYPLVMLLDDLEHVYTDDNAMMQQMSFRHWIVRLQSDEVLDQFGEIRMRNGESLLRLRVVKPDGRIVEPEQQSGVNDISLTNLAVGDVVELLAVAFDTQEQNDPPFGDGRLLQTPVPAVLRRLVVDIPSAWSKEPQFALLQENGAAPAEKKASPYQTLFDEDRVTFAFTGKNIDAARPEPWAPAEELFAPWAGFRKYDDVTLLSLWQDHRRAGWQIFVDTQPQWFRDAARWIAVGHSDSSTEIDTDTALQNPTPTNERTRIERAQVARIVSFVLNHIEEEGNEVKPSAILSSGKGIRLMLLLALLQEAGFDVDPVAMRLANDVPLSVPTSQHWQHYALRVQLSDGPHFILLDNNVVSVDTLPPAAWNAEILPLPLDGVTGLDTATKPKIEKLPSSVVDQNPVAIKIDAQIVPNNADMNADEQGQWTMVGKVIVDVPAAFAEPMRQAAKQITPEQLRSFVENGLQKTFPGVVAQEAELHRVEWSGAPLQIQAKIRIPLDDQGAASWPHIFASGGAASFGLAVSLENYVRVAERKQPAIFLPSKEQISLTLHLAKGQRFVDVPNTLRIQNGPVALQQTVSVKDGTLQWTRQMQVKAATISANDWTHIRQELTSLLGQLDTQVSWR